MTDQVGQVSEAVSEAVTEKVTEHVTFLQWFWHNVLWKPGTGEMLWGMVLRVIFALLLWKLGTRIIRRVLRLTERPRIRMTMDQTMQSFLGSLTRALLYGLLLLAVIAVVGVPMASVTAVVASTGVTLGLGMQGALANLAGGLMLTLTRPFAIGDYIEVGENVGGNVTEISLFYTVLNGIDNKKITLPNGNLMNSNIKNYSAHPKRRLDLSFLVGREADIATVRDVLAAAIAAEKARVLAPPDAAAAPFVSLTEIQEKGLVFTLRVWCQNQDYWDLNFALTTRIAEAFQQRHIALPAAAYRMTAKEEK